MHVPAVAAFALLLHSFSAEGNVWTRDLVDLQLPDKGEDLDLPQVRATCVRLFENRPKHPAFIELTLVKESCADDVL